MKYTNVSQLYDATYHSRVGDMEFYKDYIAGRKATFLEMKSVLEIGAGTGRVLLPIAATHVDVRFTAIDVIPEELTVLNERAAKLDVKNIDTLCVNLNDYKIGPIYDVATAPFRVLQHCLSIDEMDAFFKNVNDLLVPGGTFVFDLFNPSIPMLGKTGVIFKGEYADEEKNKILREVQVNERDYFTQTQKVEEYYNVQYQDGSTGAFKWIYSTRYWFKDEVVPLLQRNNFCVDNLYGSFDKQAYGKAHYPGELIFVCSKLKGPQ